MCARLICNDVGYNAAFNQLPMDLGCVAEKSDRLCVLCLDRRHCLSDRVIKIFCCNIDLFERKPALDTPRIYFNKNSDSAVECNSLRLRSAHFAKACREHELAREIAPTVLHCK